MFQNEYFDIRNPWVVTYWGTNVYGEVIDDCNCGTCAWRGCVQGCEQTGCVDGHCFNSCNFPVNVDLEGNILPKKSLDLPHEKFLKEPLYLGWKKWDCISECRYQCMLREEVSRGASSEPPVKYHNKWPFLRIYSLQVYKFNLFCFDFMIGLCSFKSLTDWFVLYFMNWALEFNL